MVSVIGLLLLTVGVVTLLRPEWIEAMDRRYKAAGTTLRPREVEMSAVYHLVVRATAVGFVLFGLALTLSSL